MAKYVYLSSDERGGRVELRFDAEGQIVGYQGDVPLAALHIESQHRALEDSGFRLAEVHLLGSAAQEPAVVEHADGSMTFPDDVSAEPSTDETTMRTRTVDFREAFSAAFQLRTVLDDQDNLVSMEGPALFIAEDYRRQYGLDMRGIANKMRLMPTEYEGAPPPMAEVQREPAVESFEEVVARARRNASPGRPKDS